MSSLLPSTRNTRALPFGDQKYIRSDCPDRLSDEEVMWLRQNGVATVVDLREESEYTQRPCRLESEEGFTYYHLPVTGGGGVPESSEAVVSSYLGMIDGQMDRIIRTIEEAPGRVLFFCTAGKDRTGVVSAILLKRLGADDRTIIADYMASKENLIGFLETYLRERPELDRDTVIPNERNIRAVLDSLRRGPDRLHLQDGRFAESSIISLRGLDSLTVSESIIRAVPDRKRRIGGLTDGV